MVKRHVAVFTFACIVFVAISLVTAHVQSREPLFAPAPRLEVGPGSGQVVLVDVDRDGRVDMITRHLLQRRVSVFMGDGNGGFTAAAAGPVMLGYRPGMIAVADVNGDTLPDLAIASSERDEVGLFLGNGQGGFAPATGSPFSVSGSRARHTRGVQLIDVNSDRHFDIVTFNGLENTFGILLGNGRGDFSPAPLVRRESLRQRHTFAFGDLDGDGYVDAVIATRGDGMTQQPGRVVILRGDRVGTFREMTPALSVPPNPHFVTLADTNGDRALDIVISHGGSSLLTLLVNDGGKISLSSRSPLDVGREAFAVVAHDANSDAKPDLLIATADSATVMISDGKGRFVPAPGSPFEAGPGAYRIVSADINGDGKADIATSSFEGSSVAILLRR